ncbi:MAG: prepilin peptidase, partial [Rhizomicrobium sp.]|nr:prepilin peptidase [Rhizomicrobium sp.]
MTDICFIVLLVMAPFIGSFLGVVVQRWGRETLGGRSHCDYCGHELAAADLVPLVSWLALGGKCRYCGAKLGAFFPAIEILAIAPVLWAATQMEGPLLIATSLFGWLLLALSGIDWRSQRLPDALTALLAVLGLTAAAYFDFPNLQGHLIGLLAGFSAFWLVGVVYQFLRKRTGLGLGDAKLLAG